MDLNLNYKHHQKQEAVDNITFVEELLLLEGTNTVRQHSFTQRKVDFIVVDHINPLEQKEFDYSLDASKIGQFA